MSKLLAIDFGSKRTGLAETDDLQMMAFGLTAVDTSQLFSFLEKYLKNNQVTTLVVGESLNLQGEKNDIEKEIEKFLKKFAETYPNIPIEREDERFTSKMAMQSLIQMGKKKKKRQDKYLIDEMSATHILQSYLERIQK